MTKKHLLTTKKEHRAAGKLATREQADAREAGEEASPEFETVAQVDSSGLTIEEAAQLLHVSRSHVNALADSGALGKVLRTAGGHRLFSRASVLTYKVKSKCRQARGLSAMMLATDEMGLYDLELQPAAARQRKPH